MSRVACLLAPCVLVTDNRKDLKPFDLAPDPSTAIALDLFAVGQFELTVQRVALAPTLAGAATIEGSKAIVAKLGKDAAAVIALPFVGALVVYLRSDSGRRARTSLADVTKRVGPPLMELLAEGQQPASA